MYWGTCRKIVYSYWKYTSPTFSISYITQTRTQARRLISVVDVVITLMNAYQPIPFHILSFAVFQSRILIYAGHSSREKRILEEYGYLVNKINMSENIYMQEKKSHHTLQV